MGKSEFKQQNFNGTDSNRMKHVLLVPYCKDIESIYGY